MAFVSLTRLRIRSLRFMPFFVVDTLASLRQVKRSQGFVQGKLLPDRKLTFWTMTMWDSEASMRAYMISGSHKTAMPKLMRWCDEASVANWTQEEEQLPSWLEADTKMRTGGRASKVLHPSANHAGLTYDVPRTTMGGPIQRAGTR